MKLGMTKAIIRTYNYHIHVLLHVRRMLSAETAVTIGCSLVLSRLDYCNALLYGAPSATIHKLQRVQNTLARVVTQSSGQTSAQPLLQSLHWLGCQSINGSGSSWRHSHSRPV